MFAFPHGVSQNCNQALLLTILVTTSAFFSLPFLVVLSCHPQQNPKLLFQEHRMYFQTIPHHSRLHLQQYHKSGPTCFKLFGFYAFFSIQQILRSSPFVTRKTVPLSKNKVQKYILSPTQTNFLVDFLIFNLLFDKKSAHSPNPLAIKINFNGKLKQ